MIMIARLRALAHHLNKANMSTTIHNTNTACCSIPPVHSGDYTPKGAFKPHGSFEKVYVTGPDSSDNAIICIYDIFGCVRYPQTIGVVCE
jgi:hypothetical protein